MAPFHTTDFTQFLMAGGNRVVHGVELICCPVVTQGERKDLWCHKLLRVHRASLFCLQGVGWTTHTTYLLTKHSAKY